MTIVESASSRHVQQVAELVRRLDRDEIHLLPQHPHVEIVESRTGSRAVIKATRVGVDVIVGYHHAGYTPEQIVTELLPHLTLAQVYDALAYYHDHADEIDALLETNTTEAWQERLRQRMGDTAYAKLAGDAAQA